MTPITPTIRFMTPEETRSRKLANAGSILMYGKAAIPLGAGRKESTVLYVLSTNNKLGYLGLEIFDASSGENTSRYFYSMNGSLKNTWGRTGSKWNQLQLSGSL